MAIRRLQTEQEVEDQGSLDLFDQPTTVQDLQQIVATPTPTQAPVFTPAPTPTPAPFNPAGFDWGDWAAKNPGLPYKNVNGTVYQPVYQDLYYKIC